MYRRTAIDLLSFFNAVCVFGAVVEKLRVLRFAFTFCVPRLRLCFYVAAF